LNLSRYFWLIGLPDIDILLSRNVSFKYPGTEKFALRKVSFKIEPGRLCVGVLPLQADDYDHAKTLHDSQIIVGANGSGVSASVLGSACLLFHGNIGKSTVLRLISRIYDPVEGEIFIDGRNIRSLKVVDLRRAISVLFQDYTHFPLSVSFSRTNL
jgi:ABC-type multidrug transport system fused ATPase/permease subunit